MRRRSADRDPDSAVRRPCEVPPPCAAVAAPPAAARARPILIHLLVILIQADDPLDGAFAGRDQVDLVAVVLLVLHVERFDVGWIVRSCWTATPPASVRQRIASRRRVEVGDLRGTCSPGSRRRTSGRRQACVPHQLQRVDVRRRPAWCGTACPCRTCGRSFTPDCSRCGRRERHRSTTPSRRAR